VKGRTHSEREKNVSASRFAETLGFVEDLPHPTRAELPAALPVPAAPDESANLLGEALGIRDVAALIGCSVWTVRQRCLRQGLPHFRTSRTGRLIFYRKQVVRWLFENQTARRW
jgi:hypothetical protein